MVYSGSWSASKRTTSVSVFGARYVKDGKRNMDQPSETSALRVGQDVQPLLRHLDLAWGREVKRRYATRTKARFLALYLGSKRLEHLVWRNGNLVNTHPNGIVHRIGDGGNHWQQRALPRFLGAIGALGIQALNKDGVH